MIAKKKGHYLYKSEYNYNPFHWWEF